MYASFKFDTNHRSHSDSKFVYANSKLDASPQITNHILIQNSCNAIPNLIQVTNSNEKLARGLGHNVRSSNTQPGGGGGGGVQDSSVDRLGTGGAAGEFSSPGSTFCADSYLGIRSTPMLPQLQVKDPGHSAKSVDDRLQLNTPLTCVALHKVTRCMVVWCTQNVPRRQQFHVAPAMPAL